ncbi:monovalent cation/H+ antiporter subunit D [Immundisolibacter cernigliae]|uniref:Cation:proton antiporter n=1 Tax=Immundisolibacter cernigliae TaxID=1810504 RepID=A0A1B1YT83_9GAMM|nr:monovalent cation/H+ antiporter subunit D [Immundisolibacter cernigliae]ANX04048.1 cation:proton antiporter [Immundisolibacter cernigliae]
MSHWPIIPILLPLFAAVLLLVLERWRPAWQLPVNLLATAALLVICVGLLGRAADGGVTAYLLGNWQAPFGIVLAVDRLAALVLTLTAVLALASLLAAAPHWHRRGAHFHPLFQMQVMGLNGAFLTADLFNLFVFFEVLLIASYGLLLHGGGRRRLHASLHFVTLNLVGSALFLLGVSLLYGVTGTLNMADLAVKVAQAPDADLVLLHAAGLLLLVVFGLKAAVLPLGLWLPTTYSAASAPVAALFAIMTKVGVYAIVRVFTLIFVGERLAVAAPLLLPLGLATLALASLGALSAGSLPRLAGYLTMASAGTLLAAVGMTGDRALVAALYYLPQTTLAVAALFLLAELIARQRGDLAGALVGGPALRQPALLGGMFLLAAATLAGLPPFSGFVGKLLILRGALGQVGGFALWAVLLLSGFALLIAFSRAGSRLFWKVSPAQEGPRHGVLAMVPVFGLLAAGVLLAVLAAPVLRFTDAAAQQLLAPTGYIDAVLGARPVLRGGVTP